MEPDREKEVYIPTISAITKSTGMVIDRVRDHRGHKIQDGRLRHLENYEM